MRTLLLLLMLGGYLYGDVVYLRAWDTRLTLALWEVQHAPRKPRVLTELALSLMEVRRLPEAAIVLDELALLVTDAALPRWDREDARQAVRSNRLLLARLTDARRMGHQ